MPLWKKISRCRVIGGRENQEDAFGIDDVNNFICVADGLGGHAHGELASQLTVDKAMVAIASGPNSTVLRSAILDANAEMLRSRDGRGTTFTALWFKDSNSAHGVHIGDSLLWHISRINGVVKATLIITEHESPDGYLTQCVGLPGLTTNLIDDVFQAIVPGDLFVLATDGILPRVGTPDDVLMECIPVQGDIADDLAEQLAATAASRGSTDNCTIIVVQF